ncbi:hypothetical protein [Burkholderia gladioli]|uniref:hypothetical protein n=1 Tax=Burkholderia gladioli TaxID=28095 RepID=UPI00164157FF|nr:hypothetical protein [Burkholderia gladioli]
MVFFELEPSDISDLDAGDLRELVARLCEAELLQQGRPSTCVTWGGAQEAPDGGLDVRIADTGLAVGNGFVPRGSCGIQVKKHVMGEAACRKEMLDSGTLKPVIAELAGQHGAYIIVSGKDDCSDSMLASRLRGMKSAVEQLPNKADLLLDFYGRDRLANWLRRHPSVSLWARARLGKPLSGWKSFGRWAATPPRQDDAYLADDHPCVIDVNSTQKNPVPALEGIELVRDRLRTGDKAVRITGLSGVGKTRFAQALFEPDVGDGALSSASTIYADLGESLAPTATELVSYLIANGHMVYLVLDNCPPDVHRQLQKQVSESNAKLSLLTIEYDVSDDRPEETEVIHIEPSGEKTVSLLIQRRFPDLGQTNADKITEFSGGNARVAIALASRVDADETLTNFSDEALFQRLFRQRNSPDDQVLEVAEVLSLVYSFNVSLSVSNDEMGALAAISGLSRRTLSRGLAELLRRQLTQSRGDWRAVLPHALANRLAKRALESISPDEINAEILKLENRRLFYSCAHRLGYLHDVEPVRRLADSWVAPGGPMHDIRTLDEKMLSVFHFIAPVFPDIALRLIEAAASDPEFASTQNPNAGFFARLLAQLAYDDDKFDRATTVLLKFAESEKADEANNGFVGQLQQLLSLHLSGTQAAPSRRREVIAKLLASGTIRNLEIAQALFHAALEARHWISYSMFDFGARRRDTGWSPRTSAEVADWYIGFLHLLELEIASSEPVRSEWARALFAGHFRSLWTRAFCPEVLEDIVRSHAHGGWPKLWLAIKRTLHFDCDDARPELVTRLMDLERLTAPSDLASEIQAYVLVHIHEHIESAGEITAASNDIVVAKIISLGKSAASNLGVLDRLGERLWAGEFDALHSFGVGIALGSADQMATFERLLEMAYEQATASRHPIFLGGFIQAAHDTDSGMGRAMQKRILNHSVLRPHFIYLLGVSRIEPWGIEVLLELARSKEYDVSRFRRLAYGRMHEALSDAYLALLLTELIDREEGIYVSLDILTMRFHIGKDSSYLPGDELLSIGRDVIHALVSVERGSFAQNRIHGMESVAGRCLVASAPIDEVQGLVTLLCARSADYHLYSFELDPIVSTLASNFPELLLDEVFTGDERERRLIRIFSKDGVRRKIPFLNSAPLDRLIAWCQVQPDRFARVATAMSVFTHMAEGSVPLAQSASVVLSEQIKGLLGAAPDKQSVLRAMAAKITPSSWSGSRAQLMETRAQAFDVLKEHPSPEVRAAVVTELEQIDQDIRMEREYEATRDKLREQRFE